MRVVVVGASGNVGYALLRRLTEETGVEVVGVSRRIPQNPLCPWHSIDISQYDAANELCPVFQAADVVVHLAWLIQPSHDQHALWATNVYGTRNVLAAAAAADVGAVIYASSVGVYSPGPKDQRVHESHPTEGVPGSLYSQHKVETERMLDRFELDNPETRVVRLRKAIVTSREAASEQSRYFLGPFFPSRLLRPGKLPVLPLPEKLRFQIVHSEDVAEAYYQAIVRDVRGPFNIAAEPVIDPQVLGSLVGSRPVNVPGRVVRGAVNASWRLRVQPTDPGWPRMALESPLLDTRRAEQLLGWKPKHTSTATLLEALDAVRHQDGGPTPPLRSGSVLGNIRAGVKTLTGRAGSKV